MGIASSAVKNTIIMGGLNAANSIADGEPVDKVILDTATSAVGGVLGGAVSEAVGGSIMKMLVNKGLSDKSIMLIASLPSGLSFGTTATAVEESKNYLYYGKDYRPDMDSILHNMTFLTVFGTLQAFRSAESRRNPKGLSQRQARRRAARHRFYQRAGQAAADAARENIACQRERQGI